MAAQLRNQVRLPSGVAKIALKRSRLEIHCIPVMREEVLVFGGQDGAGNHRRLAIDVVDVADRGGSRSERTAPR